MRTVICIPTYNERDNLPSLVAEILHVTDADVLIVDDNSPDSTGDEADRIARGERRVSVVHREARQGVGRAYREAFRRAVSAGYENVFEMDADFSHQPRYLPEMIAALERSEVVIGSRYVEGGGVGGWGLRRRIVSRGSNWYAQAALGIAYHDATSGFVGFRRHVLEAIDFERIESDGYAFQIELKFRAHRLGFRIVEVPIVFFDRSAGASKMARRTIGQAMLKVLELRLRGGA